MLMKPDRWAISCLLYEPIKTIACKAFLKYSDVIWKNFTVDLRWRRSDCKMRTGLLAVGNRTTHLQLHTSIVEATTDWKMCALRKSPLIVFFLQWAGTNRQILLLLQRKLMITHYGHWEDNYWWNVYIESTILVHSINWKNIYCWLRHEIVL